jgi:starvation-inducible outer membrane lipoprotein
MKRTQQSVLLAALALSLSACSYIPWRIVSAPTTPLAPVAHGTTSEQAPAPSATVAPSSTSEKGSPSTVPPAQ